jgi:cytochrome c oxidase subunit II
MPTPVRRLAVLTCAATFTLVGASAALAGNGGVAPPSPASPNAQNIRDIYWLILAVTGAIFLIVTLTLLIFIVRYRSKGRPREVEGPQVRGNTRLELAWTAGPVVLLAIIAGFVFWKVSDIGATAGLPASERNQPREEITIDAHQYYWEFRYPNGAISVDRLRLPYNRPVRLTILANDVDHSWWVPALGGKLDAIPGKRNHTTFRATKLGTFRGQCAEFCGLLHAAMIARVEVLPADEYDTWVDERAGAQTALGKETFQGVCAKCHGLGGQGDIGPNIAQSGLLGDREALAGVIRNGTGTMPAVGNDWPKQQLDATISYLQRRFQQQQGGNDDGQG